tara:strand:+ start:1358 stop:1660 length:303 start_codon:yes stop_codon:yes gene_type:complete
MEGELKSENLFNTEIKKFSNIEIDIDDSFLHHEDKKNIFIHLKKLYEIKFEWADESLIKSFMLVHYKQFITNMHEGNNIEIYLNERTKNNEKDFNINDFF